MLKIRFFKKIKTLISRNLLLTKNITGTFLIKGLAIVISLLSMPAYIAYFSELKVLGIWFTILSILNWILTFDLGIGNGLRNNLVGAFVKKDNIEVKKQISSAYIILGLISIITLILGWILIGFFNWNELLNISTDILRSDVLLITIRIVFCGVIIQFWLRIIVSILYAMQKNVIANSLGLITNFLILVYLLIGIQGDINLKTITLAYVNIISILLPLVLVTIYIFATLLKDAKPSFNYFDKIATQKIVSLGGMFFIIQLGLLIVNSSNQLLIATLHSSEDVVEYQAYYKFFSFATMIFALFTQPIWSATTDAYARGNIKWIKKVFLFLNIIALLGGIASFAVIPKLQVLFNFWLGENTIVVSTSTGMIFATLACCEMIMYSSTCIANGIGKLKTQFVTIIFAAILKIPVTIYLSQYLGTWESVVIAYILMLLPTIIFQPISLKNSLKIKSY